jgi:putative transposase
MDNVFIERLWRSVKYECVYLHAFETGSELRAGLRAGSPTITTIGPIPPLPAEPRQRHMGTSAHQIMGACPHDLMAKLAA